MGICINKANVKMSRSQTPIKNDTDQPLLN